MPLVIVAIGVVLLLLLMIRFKLNGFIALVLVALAVGLMQGMPLVKQVDRKLATDIDLFSRGGMEILTAIERQDYAVLGCRPAISKARKLALVARAALGKLR